MIKLPDMRKELISYLMGLTDHQYQIDCWVKKQCPKGIENDELDYAVHFLFDDTQLSENPDSLIGCFLYNKQEANAVKLVCESLDYLFEKYGNDKSDAEFISFPEWKNVIESSRKALIILRN